MLSIVRIVGFCRLHFSVQVAIESVILEIDWNEIVPSIPFHQFLKMSSHSLTNFAENRNHVTTIMSQIEVLLSLHAISANTAQHFVYTDESSVHRSE